MKSVFILEYTRNRIEEEALIVGDRVREIRHERGLTQAELSEKTGIGCPALSKIETGKARPHRVTITALALALGVEPESLLGEPNDN